MKIENSIGWTDDTTNAVTGCDKVSPGCAHCYAQVGTRARVLRAQEIETWGPNGVRHPVAQFAAKIRALNKKCVCDKCHWGFPVSALVADVDGFKAGKCRFDNCGGTLRRIRLFADSNSDWLDAKWPVETLANFLNEIRLAPNVDVLLLTKRISNFEERLHDVAILNFVQHFVNDWQQFGEWIDGWLDGDAPANVWLGVSVENQKYADLRIPQLLKIPATVRFLSCEPLLDFVDLDAAIASGNLRYATKREADAHLLHWVIVGGESGKNRRDCGVEAIVDVARQCVAAGVPVYVKQDVAFKSGEQGRIPEEVWGLKQFPKVYTNCTD